MWTISTLSDLRDDVKTALTEGLTGTNVKDYSDGRFLPPVAIVVPNGMVPSDRPGGWNVTIQVVLIAKAGINSANELDDLTFQAVRALDEHDILEVSAPQEVTLRNNGQATDYWGVILTLEFDTIINKEEN